MIVKLGFMLVPVYFIVTERYGFIVVMLLEVYKLIILVALWRLFKNEEVGGTQVAYHPSNVVYGNLSSDLKSSAELDLPPRYTP